MFNRELSHWSCHKKKNLPLIIGVFLTQPGFHVKITLSSQTCDGMAVILDTALLPLASYF